MRYFWVLGTSSVTYTDRIYVMRHGSHQLLYSAMLGGPFSVNPSYVLPWVNPDTTAGELDMAGLVHDFGSDSLDILIFNFDTKKRDIAFRLWRRLDFGKYTLKIGNDSNHDDRIDGPPHTSFNLTYDARGMTVVLPKVPNGVLQKVELRRVSSISGSGAQLPDLAVGRHDLVLKTGGLVAVTVHNLGSADLTGGNMKLLEGSRILGTHPIPAIEAPNDLTPRSVTLTVPYRPLGFQAKLNVRLEAPAGVKEVTLFNNDVEVRLPVINPALTLVPLTGFGRMDLNVDSPHDPGKLFFIGTGFTGTSPGIPVGPGLVLPLNWDLLTELSLLYPPVFNYPLGILDARGKGLMQVRFPYIPALEGLPLYFAAATFTLSDGFRAVSRPVNTRL